jgi:hypothetical protein
VFVIFARWSKNVIVIFINFKALYTNFDDY